MFVVIAVLGGFVQTFYSVTIFICTKNHMLYFTLIDAETKIGELLENTVKERGEITLGSHGRTKSLPDGIDKKHSHYFQKLPKNTKKWYIILPNK